jgi:hypothetical protein
MRHACLTSLCLALLGCATTKPELGANMEYRLPRTDAIVTVTMTLKNCNDFDVDSSFTVTPQAGY